VADGIDAAVDPMQGARFDALAHGLMREPELAQLPGGHGSVLARGDLGQLRIKGEAGGCVTFLRSSLSFVAHPLNLAGPHALFSSLLGRF
jgi:hypothetical protein